MKTKCLFLFVALVVLGQLAAIPLANASSQHLRCADGFSQIVKSSRTISCFKSGTFSSRQKAVVHSSIWRGAARCNAHRSAVKHKIAKWGNHWVVNVNFLCTNIN